MSESCHNLPPSPFLPRWPKYSLIGELPLGRAEGPLERIGSVDAGGGRAIRSIDLHLFCSAIGALRGAYGALPIYWSGL